jgi:hypothetical protein
MTKDANPTRECGILPKPAEKSRKRASKFFDLAFSEKSAWFRLDTSEWVLLGLG